MTNRLSQRLISNSTQENGLGLSQPEKLLSHQKTLQSEDLSFYEQWRIFRHPAYPAATKTDMQYAKRIHLLSRNLSVLTSEARAQDTNIIASHKNYRSDDAERLGGSIALGGASDQSVRILQDAAQETNVSIRLGW